MKAFPIVIDRETQVANDTNFAIQESGMDLRDYFAAKAMQGFISEGTMFETKQNEFQSDACAKAAYEWADAMMKARSK